MITIDGHRLKWRVLDYLQERDGVKVPHVVKQIFCDPPAPIDIIQKNVKIKETLGNQDQDVLSQFLKDCKNF